LISSTHFQAYVKQGTVLSSTPPGRRVPFRMQRAEKSAGRTTATQMGCLTCRSMRMFQR